MPTTILVVSCLSSQDHLHEKVKRAFNRYGERLISQINSNHQLEEICILSYNGNTCEIVGDGYSREKEVLQNSLTGIAVSKGANLLLPTHAFTSCFNYIENTLGRHSHSQIIILTDYSQFEDELFRMRPTFPAKVHIFSIWSGDTDSSSMPTNRVFHRLEQLAQINGGTFVHMNESSKSVVSSQVNRFINHYYAKYTGYLAMGHLISSIYLHPDPNLTLWNYFATKREDTDEDQIADEEFLPHVLNIVGFIENKHISSPKCISKHTILPYTPPPRKKKKKSSRKSGDEPKKKKKKKSVDKTEPTDETEPTPKKKKKKKSVATTEDEGSTSTTTSKKKKKKSEKLGMEDKEGNESVKSKENDKGYILGHMAKKDRDMIFGLNRKFVKADACQADTLPGSSFYELLHNTLMAMKACAIVQLHQDHYGYISVVHDAEFSALVLGVLDEKTTLNHGNLTIHNEQLPVIQSTSVQAYPWLRDSMQHMIATTATELATTPTIEYAAHQQGIPAELNAGQLELLREDVNMKTYNYNLKSSKVIVPFTKMHTMTTDFTKIYRVGQNLPLKVDLFITEVEKVRYIGRVYMNPSLNQSVGALLNELRDSKLQVMKESPEKLDDDYLTIAILDSVIQQVLGQKGPIKAPEQSDLLQAVAKMKEYRM